MDSPMSESRAPGSTDSVAGIAAASERSYKTLWVVPLVFLVDQITKYAIRICLELGSPWPADALYLRLTYIHNPGAVFGLDLGNMHVHTGVSLVALGALVWLFRSLPANARLSQIALAMVLGGALGNIVDRFVHDAGVVDFFDVGVSEQWRWPIFNVADSFVTIGILLLALGFRRHPPAGAATRDPVPADPRR